MRVPKKGVVFADWSTRWEAEIASGQRSDPSRRSSGTDEKTGYADNDPGGHIRLIEGEVY